MCTFPDVPRRRMFRLVSVALAAVLVLALPALPAALAADPRLEQAQAKRAEVQQRLDAVVGRLMELEAKRAEAEARLAELTAQEQAQQAQAQAASGTLAARIRDAYTRGSIDPGIALLTSESPQQVMEQARLLGLLAMRSRADVESASAARIRTEAAAYEVELVAGDLAARSAEVEAARAEVADMLRQAQAEEQKVRDTIAREERERREREERARRAREAQERAERERRQRVSRQQAPASAPAAPSAPAPVAGGIACPIGAPRSYTDTYGAPRSGGRSHRGTDIMAPRGTPIYAYESGSISRLTNSSLGGISIYLRGDSGNVYYYTHLQGYVAGLSAGQRVSVGQHVAFNGDTGNARGNPHLHFEVMPGGGGNVNPYPYVRRACG